MSKEMRETIESINSVQHCRIVQGDGGIEQIFIEADLDHASPDPETRTQAIKAIVRSVIGALAIKHRIDLDYRKIKVIDYKPRTEDTTEANEKTCSRIQIEAAYIRQTNPPTAIVELKHGTYCSSGQVPLTDGMDSGQAVFLAFSRALEQLGRGCPRLIYLHVFSNDLIRDRIVVQKLEYHGGSGERQSLLGVAPINDDLPLAVVKAAMCALNRQLS